MDTLTGEIYYDAKEILEAIKNGDIKNPNVVAAIPDGVVRELECMNQNERVKWWEKNNKKAIISGWISICCKAKVIKWLTGFECTKCHKKDVKVLSS